MRARDVVGRTIVGIRHVTYFNAHVGQRQVDCVQIQLDNGGIISAEAYETIDIPQTTLRYIPPPCSP